MTRIGCFGGLFTHTQPFTSLEDSDLVNIFAIVLTRVSITLGSSVLRVLGVKVKGVLPRLAGVSLIFVAAMAPVPCLAEGIAPGRSGVGGGHHSSSKSPKPSKVSHSSRGFRSYSQFGGHNGLRH